MSGGLDSFVETLVEKPATIKPFILFRIQQGNGWRRNVDREIENRKCEGENPKYCVTFDLSLPTSDFRCVLSNLSSKNVM